MKRKYCRWKYDDELDMYETQCGKGHVFITSGVKNKHTFCPYCGLRIKEVTP